MHQTETKNQGSREESQPGRCQCVTVPQLPWSRVTEAQYIHKIRDSWGPEAKWDGRTRRRPPVHGACSEYSKRSAQVVELPDDYDDSLALRIDPQWHLVDTSLFEATPAYSGVLMPGWLLTDELLINAVLQRVTSGGRDLPECCRGTGPLAGSAQDVPKATSLDGKSVRGDVRARILQYLSKDDPLDFARFPPSSRFLPRGPDGSSAGECPPSFFIRY
uniref:Uncharacterized protein n=1 Tax=Knipowitschia caucasica TaxID=637954 RepID=A0AAV2K4J9_KNICA